MSGETAYLLSPADSFFAKAFAQLATLSTDTVTWVLVGGLAVSARLGTSSQVRSPHRATTDVDAVAEDLHELFALLGREGGKKTEGRVMLHGVPVDALPVPGTGAGRLPDARAWAYRSAEPLRIVVSDPDGVLLATAEPRVATAAGLILLKLESAVHAYDRTARKRATDVYDVLRLYSSGAAAFTGAIGDVPHALKADAAQCARDRLIRSPATTIRYWSDAQRDEFPVDDMKSYGEALIAALTR